MKGATIEASHRRKYVTFINDNNESEDEQSKSERYDSDKSEEINEQNDSENQNNTDDSSDINEKRNEKESNRDSEKSKMTESIPVKTSLKHVQRDQVRSISPIVGCRDGGEPGGAHQCISCKRAVHILPCCSVSIGDNEGYGEKRMCNACAHEKSKTSSPNQTSVSQAVSEMDYTEPWNKTKKKTTSKYMKPAPNWNLNYNVAKKLKIGILKNGNLCNITHKVGKNQTIALTDTCSFDSICQVSAVYQKKVLTIGQLQPFKFFQVLAGAYAYYAHYRKYMDDSKSPLYEIAIDLAKKYVIKKLLFITYLLIFFLIFTVQIRNR